MKKYFFNTDGTIKLRRAIILVDVITLIILLLIFMGLFKNQDLTPRVTTTTKKTTTTTIKLCKNCHINFNRQDMIMEPNSSYPLEDLVDLKGVEIHNVKFSISDTTKAKIDLVDGKTSIVAENTIGSFTLTAKYLDLEANLVINIGTNKLESVNFKNLAYYLHMGETIDLGIVTSPVGYNIDNINISVDDSNIVELVDNKSIKGKNLGVTKVKIDNNGSIISANVYVVKNKITIKVKENYTYQEKDIIEYNSDGVEILLQIESNNNTYTNEDIVPVINDMGSFITEVSYVSKSSSLENAYIYRLNFKKNNNKIMDVDYSLIQFKLSDGIIKEFKIERKQ